MKAHISIILASLLILVSCSSSVSDVKKEQSANPTLEWQDHPKKAVPNIFGDTAPKRFLRGGYYEQSGSVTSSASWESGAHYTYLGRKGIEVGIAQHPYSISPSGRFVVIPEQYVSGSTHHVLKIYDSKFNRFVLRKIPSNIISSYKWQNEHTIQVLFEDSSTIKTIMLPKP